MKTSLYKFLITFATLLIGVSNAFAANPPTPKAKVNLETVNGNIDENIIILSTAALLFGLYAIYKHNKTKAQI
jgi:H+/gluconate symporter-like permease